MPPSSSRSHGAGAFLDEFFKRPQGWNYTAPSFHELLTGDHSGGSKPSVRRRVERARLANLDVRIVAAAFELAQMVVRIAVLDVQLDHRRLEQIDGVMIHYRGATASKSPLRRPPTAGLNHATDDGERSPLRNYRLSCKLSCQPLNVRANSSGSWLCMKCPISGNERWSIDWPAFVTI